MLYTPRSPALPLTGPSCVNLSVGVEKEQPFFFFFFPFNRQSNCAAILQGEAAEKSFVSGVPAGNIAVNGGPQVNTTKRPCKRKTEQGK